MTLRDSRVRPGNRNSDLHRIGDDSGSTTKGLLGRLRKQRRRKVRRLLSESLEPRQLLAGPDLVGIQPNEGSLLQDGTVLDVSPRELVFRFNDDANLDPNTLSAIRITRAGEDRAFESATATSDLLTDGQVLLEFRAQRAGSLGNGIELQFTSSPRSGSSLPLISVSERTISVNLNSQSGRETRVQDLVSAVAANPAAAELIEVLQVSGPSSGIIGSSQIAGGL